MSEQSGADGQSVERGAAEEASGTPLTPTEIDNSGRAPSEPRSERAGGDDPIVVDDAAGMGGGASGGSGGGSGMPGHPDAAR